MKIKSTLIFCIIFFLHSHSFSKKRVCPYPIVFAKAELIIVGEIVEIDSSTYKFKIFDTLKGNESDFIVVNKYEDWNCDVRFDEFKINQQLFLCLEKGNQNWDIINGSTGEIPIKNNKAVLRNEIVKVNKENMIPILYETNLDSFKSGIKHFLNCFEFLGECEKYDKSGKFLQICSNEELQLFISKSQFTSWLYSKLENFKIEQNVKANGT